MQTKTMLALFCTIVVLLIGVNDGATTTQQSLLSKTTLQSLLSKSTQQSLLSKTTLESLLSKTDAPVGITVAKPTVRAGGRTEWKTKIDPKSRKLFYDNKKVISKKLQTVHKVPASFNPKPEKTASQIVSGILYHYLVKLPNKKYAYVTINDRPWKKAQLGSEEHVTVRPQLYALNDKDI